MVFTSAPLGAPRGITLPTGIVAAEFVGNPNVSVTSVDTSGGILLSRASGSLPAFVQASASLITATGSSWLTPYEDLDFSWNFGDPGGTHSFVHPVTGATMNPNTDQKGPEAVYAYTVASTYTITLTIKWKNAGTTFQTQIQTNFTANTFTPVRERWVDPVSGSDGNAGTSSGAAWQTFTNVRALDWNGLRLNLKRGTTITDHLGRLQSRQSVRMQSYGDPGDPNPIITFNSNTNSGHIMWADTGGGTFFFPMLDWVIQDIDWQPTGTCVDGPYIVGAVSNVDTYMQDIYFMNCTVHSNPGLTQNLISLNNVNNPTVNNNYRVGFWNCSTLGQVGSLDGAERQGIAVQGWTSWLFIIGGFFEGNGQDNIRDHHIYPIIQTHGLFRWIDFGTGTNKSHCINTDWNNNGANAASCTAGTVDNGSGTGTPAGFVLTPAGSVSGTFAVGQNVTFSGGGSGGYLIDADLGGGQFKLVDYANGSNVNLAISPRTINAKDRQYSEFILFDGNWFNGTKYAFDGTDADTNTSLVQYRNAIAQNNAYVSLSDGGPLGYAYRSLTFRDELDWAFANNGFWNPGSLHYSMHTGLAYKFYRCKSYSSTVMISITPAGTGNISSPVPFQITDCEWYNTSTAATFYFFETADVGSGSIIDRNRYFAPNDSNGTYIVSNGTAVNLATWQSNGPNYDPNSVYGDPGWTTPVDEPGDFT